MKNLPISNELLELLEPMPDKSLALLFCLAVEYGLLDTMIDSGVINRDNEHYYRINLTQVDEDGNLRLRVPLFGKIQDNTGEFYTYIEKLIQKGMTLTGFGFNMQEYTVLTTDSETQDNFVRVKLSIDNFNIDRLVDVTVKYYQQTVKAKGLKSFLAKDAITAYTIGA
jgi:hypothetical protein